MEKQQTVRKCDQCGKEEVWEEGLIGVRPFAKWIRVTCLHSIFDEPYSEYEAKLDFCYLNRAVKYLAKRC